MGLHPEAKGTVTPLSSIFPAQEARKAQDRVAGAIDNSNNDLESLTQFAAQNASLVNLVKRLPDELSHDIMVPFGKASFFPGRLIHTNEFLVLLGDGYYAERTSKQTIEIFQRRGKSLDTQINSLKAVISDLQAEASFFNATAAEASEGLFEIREEYVEKSPIETTAESSAFGYEKKNKLGGSKATVNDEEYARMMSLLDELEKEEEEEENNEGSYEDEDDESSNVETKEGEMQFLNSVQAPTARFSVKPEMISNSISVMEASKPLPAERVIKKMCVAAIGEPSCDREHKINNVPDDFPNAPVAIEDHIMKKEQTKNIDEKSENMDTGHRSTGTFKEKEPNCQEYFLDKAYFKVGNDSSSLFLNVWDIGLDPEVGSMDKWPSFYVSYGRGGHPSLVSFAARKNFPGCNDFIGSVVERKQDISFSATHSSSGQNAASNPSKPVSRFKMQRSGH